MNCKNLMVIAMLVAGFSLYGNPAFEDKANLGNFIEPVVSGIKDKFAGLKAVVAKSEKTVANAGPSLGSTFSKKEQASVMEKIKGFFIPAPIAAVEQEKSLGAQVSENPGTATAVTVGIVVALYATYKAVQYFDQIKAKKIALRKRLDVQGMQSAVVFE